MRAITQNSPVPFKTGPNRGRKILNCPDSVLVWMVKHYTDTDFHAYAMVAFAVLQDRKRKGREFQAEDDLDAQADEILRNAGCGGLAGRVKRCIKTYSDGQRKRTPQAPPE